MMFRKTAALAATLLALAPLAAHAHGSMKPSHGGMVAISGETMVEFAPSAKGLMFWITEEDEPLAASDFTATAIVTNADGVKSRHALKPMSGNLLAAPGVKVPAGAKVVIALANKGNDAKTFVTFRMK